MAQRLSNELIERLRERLNDAERRSDASSITGQTMSLDDLLGQLGPQGDQLRSISSQLQGLMGSLGGMRFAGPMMAGGVAAPTTDAPPSPQTASEEQIAAAEQAIGRAFPADLRQLYAEIGNGDFGPGGGLFPLARVIDEYEEMTREPAGPQNQLWPANLLPLVDAEPGYDCLDLDSGEMVAWDPEEIEGYSNAAWQRSFKPLAPSLTAWLEEWLGRPTAGERMKQQREQAAEHPMEFHVRNMIEFYGKMTPEERAGHGLPAEDWEAAVRKRFIPE